MKYCFDLDETLCLTPKSRKYDEAIPYSKMIDKVNSLFQEGHEITIFTARGSSSGTNYHELNLKQLKEWKVKYHYLIDKGKPSYDIFIDDKAITTKTWRKENNIIITGFIASSFDLLHAGHCLYIKDAKSVCDHLVVGLQEDPSVDRFSKNKPIQSLEERRIQLQSIKYVDEIVVYKTEQDLEELLETIKPNIRILGSDCRGKPITGYKYCTNIYYHDRTHDWSSSNLRKRCLL